MIYKTQHEDNPHDTCNDFYPINRPQENDEKIPRLPNGGGSYTLNSISNDLATRSAQSASECFRKGKPINQFRHLCSPLSYSPILKDNSDPTYSSISPLDTKKADCEAINAVTVQTDQTEDDEEKDEGAHIFKKNTNIDH